MANYYKYGATGRGIALDSDGKLLLNATAAASGRAFQYGETGRKIKVDSDGKLLVGIEGVALDTELETASGLLDTRISTLESNKHTEVLTSGNWVASGTLYSQTVNHALNDRFVTVQFYNPTTYQNVADGEFVDHYVLEDANNVEVLASGTSALGVIITR